MKNDSFPNDSPPIIALIKKYLPEDHWPVVLPALRQDLLVWEALSSPTLRQNIGEAGGPVSVRWAPGNLALLALGSPVDIETLHNSPATTLDPPTRDVARKSLESILAGASGTADLPQAADHYDREKTGRLARAGLAALGLRERHIQTGDWDAIAALRPGEETPDWACALACLYAMVPEPYGYLSLLFAPGNVSKQFDLGLHVLLSNPIEPASLLEHTLSLLSPLSRTETLYSLQAIHLRRPDLAQELARRLTEHLPTDGPADSNLQTGALRKLVGEAELYHLSGQPQKTIPLLNLAWGTITQLQARLAEILSINLSKKGNHHETPLKAFSTWQGESQISALGPTYLANHALALVEEGRETEAKAILPEETEDPQLLFAKAKVASARDYKDIAGARSLAKLSLQAAGGHSSNGPAADSKEYLPGLAALLLDLNLPYEAAQAAKEALITHPNDPDLLAILSRAFAESGRLQDAAAAIELAVLLSPRNIDLRYQLAETLEMAGDWPGALQERTTILERVEAPSALELRALANCALHTGEHQLAADVCQQALQIDSEDGLAFALLGQAHFELGSVERALEFVRQATQLAPHHPTPWLTLAALLEKIGDPSKSMETLRAATHAVPDSPEIHLALGKVYQQEHALTLAVAAFEQAANLSPENREIALHLGKTLSALGHIQKAHAVLAEAYQLTPSDPDLAYAYARVLLEEGNYRQALQALVVVIQSEPEDTAPYQDYARALLAVGEGAQDAADALGRVLEQNPENLEAQALLADAHMVLGIYDTAHQSYHKLLDSPLAGEGNWHTRLSLGLANISLVQKETEAAIAVLQSALERDTQNPEIFRKLADAYVLADLRENALETAREALRLGADDLETLTWFASLAVDLEAQAEALSALQRAVELVPRRTDLLVLLGHTRLKTGDTQGAWETFNGLLNFENPPLLDLRSAARGLLELKDAETAVELLQRGLIGAAPPDFDLLVDIANAQQTAGDFDGAMDTTDKAIALNDNMPDLHLQKAQLLIAVNRPQAAVACLQHAINLSPDDQNILRQGVEILRHAGKIEAALELAERRLQNQPADLSVRHEVADLARTLLQPEYALRILREGWPLKGIEGSKAAQSQASPDAALSTGGKLAYFNLYAELCLSAEDEIATAEALTQALQIDAGHPRTLAIQANLNARKGDIDPARALFEEIHTRLGLDRLGPGKPELGSIEPATFLSIAETALLLGEWETAVQVTKYIAITQPSDPLANLSLARCLVLQAEQQRLCTALGVINHAPGVQALSDQALRSFDQAIQAAERGLGKTYDSAHIKFWQYRGFAVYQPDSLAAQKLGTLPADPEVTAARIVVLRSMGDLQNVIAAARTYPRHPTVQTQLALTLIETNPDQAQAAAQSAADNSADNPLVQAALSAAASRNQDVIIALQAIQEALTIWPDEPRWHAAAAALFIHPDVYRGEHNLSTAIAHLDNATRLEPEHAPHFISLGKMLMKAGEIQRAVQVFEKACVLEQDQAEGWILLAESHLASGDLGKAATCADTSISLAPLEIGGPILRARVALQDEQPQEALVRSRDALHINSQDPDALFLEAQALAGLNRPTEALGSIEKALTRAQNPLPLLLERVRLIRRVQGQDAALIALRELNAGYPDDPVVFALMSKTLADTNQSEEAIFAAQQALRKGSEMLNHGELSELHLLLGRLLRRSGQRDQAIHHLSEAIQSNPINLEPFLELGRTHIERREYQAALQIFQKGILVAPNDHRPYYQAGMALKEGKDYIKAEKMLRRAAELSPNDLSIHRLLGAVVALNIVHNREATVDA